MTNTTPPADETGAHLPEHHSPLPELIHLEGPKTQISGQSYATVMASPQYNKLRSTFRNFAFPMTVAGLVSYFVYVVLSIYVPGFMGKMVFGSVNWGTLIGLAQFAVTWIWTALYVWFADTKLDAEAAALKTQLEKGAQA